MKTLILMRHGRYAEDPQNKNIVLCNQGITEVFDVSSKISERFNVQALMYSPILRTKEAAFIANTNLNLPKIQETEWLMDDYNNPRDKNGKGIETHLSKLDNEKDTICLVTHEPLITAFMLYAGSRESAREYYRGLLDDAFKSTREAMVFKFDVEKWEDIKPLVESGVKTDFSIVKGEYSKHKLIEAYRKCKDLNLSTMISPKDHNADSLHLGVIKRGIFNRLSPA